MQPSKRVTASVKLALIAVVLAGCNSSPTAAPPTLEPDATDSPTSVTTADPRRLPALSAPLYFLVANQVHRWPSSQGPIEPVGPPKPGGITPRRLEATGSLIAVGGSGPDGNALVLLQLGGSEADLPPTADEPAPAVATEVLTDKLASLQSFALGIDSLAWVEIDRDRPVLKWRENSTGAVTSVDLQTPGSREIAGPSINGEDHSDGQLSLVMSSSAPHTLAIAANGGIQLVSAAGEVEYLSVGSGGEGIQGHHRPVAFSPNGRHLLSEVSYATSEAGWALWNLDLRSARYAGAAHDGDNRLRVDMAWGEDNTLLRAINSGEDVTLAIVDPRQPDQADRVDTTLAAGRRASFLVSPTSRPGGGWLVLGLTSGDPGAIYAVDTSGELTQVGTLPAMGVVTSPWHAAEVLWAPNAQAILLTLSASHGSAPTYRHAYLGALQPFDVFDAAASLAGAAAFAFGAQP